MAVNLYLNPRTNDSSLNLKDSTLQIEQKLKSTVGNDSRCQQCYNRLVSLDNGNADVLINYILQYKHEADIADSTLTTVLLYLIRFALEVNKPFADMKREDVIGYLNHKKVGNRWRRTFKLLSIYITRFFTWFYYPEFSPKERSRREPG